MLKNVQIFPLAGFIRWKLCNHFHLLASSVHKQVEKCEILPTAGFIFSKLRKYFHLQVSSAENCASIPTCRVHLLKTAQMFSPAGFNCWKLCKYFHLQLHLLKNMLKNAQILPTAGFIFSKLQVFPLAGFICWKLQNISTCRLICWKLQKKSWLHLLKNMFKTVQKNAKYFHLQANICWKLCKYFYWQASSVENRANIFYLQASPLENHVEKCANTSNCGLRLFKTANISTCRLTVQIVPPAG